MTRSVQLLTNLAELSDVVHRTGTRRSDGTNNEEGDVAVLDVLLDRLAENITAERVVGRMHRKSTALHAEDEGGLRADRVRLSRDVHDEVLRVLLAHRERNSRRPTGRLRRGGAALGDVTRGTVVPQSVQSFGLL